MAKKEEESEEEREENEGEGSEEAEGGKRGVKRGKRVVTEEEPVAVVEEGLESCPHCGGTLREKAGAAGGEGVYKCANCGKTIVSRIVLFKPSEKQLAKTSTADATAFSKNLSKLSNEEYADFCWRLYNACSPSKYYADYSITRSEQDRVELVAHAARFHDVLLFARNTAVTKSEIDALLKKMKKLASKHAFFFAAAGFEKGAAEWADDFEEAHLISPREMTCLASEHNVALRAIERRVKALKKDEVDSAVASLTEAGVFKSFDEGEALKGRWWTIALAGGASWLTLAALFGAEEGEWKWAETWWALPLGAIAMACWLLVVRRDSERNQ